RIWRSLAVATALGVGVALLLFIQADVAHAAATVTLRGDTSVLLNTNAATGSNTFTVVKPFSVTCGAASDISATGGVRIEAPAGFTFDTTANAVSFAVTGTGTLRIGTAASGTATAGASETMLVVSTPC